MFTKKNYESHFVHNIYGLKRKKHERRFFLSPILGYAKGVWLGYSDIQKEGHYVTISNAEDLGYQNWHKGEPNDWQKNEHCAAIHLQYAGWVDYHCTAKYNYICKK